MGHAERAGIAPPAAAAAESASRRRGCPVHPAGAVSPPAALDRGCVPVYLSLDTRRRPTPEREAEWEVNRRAPVLAALGLAALAVLGLEHPGLGVAFLLLA